MVAGAVPGAPPGTAFPYHPTPRGRRSAGAAWAQPPPQTRWRVVGRGAAQCLLALMIATTGHDQLVAIPAARREGARDQDRRPHVAPGVGREVVGLPRVGGLAANPAPDQFLLAGPPGDRSLVRSWAARRERAPGVGGRVVRGRGRTEDEHLRACPGHDVAPVRVVVEARPGAARQLLPGAGRGHVGDVE